MDVERESELGLKSIYQPEAHKSERLTDQRRRTAVTHIYWAALGFILFFFSFLSSIVLDRFLLLLFPSDDGSEEEKNEKVEKAVAQEISGLGLTGPSGVAADLK